MRANCTTDKHRKQWETTHTTEPSKIARRRGRRGCWGGVAVLVGAVPFLQRGELRWCCIACFPLLPLSVRLCHYSIKRFTGLKGFGRCVTSLFYPTHAVHDCFSPLMYLSLILRILDLFLFFHCVVVRKGRGTGMQGAQGVYLVASDRPLPHELTHQQSAPPTSPTNNLRTGYFPQKRPRAFLKNP